MGDDGKKDGRATGYRSGYLEQMEELLNSPEGQKLKAKMASDSSTLWKKIKELFGKGLGDEGDEGSGSGDTEATNPKNETTTPGGDKGPTTPTKPTLVVKTQKTPEAQKLGGDTQDPEGSGTARDEE